MSKTVTIRPPSSTGPVRGTLVFDLDGTLVDSVPDLLASCNRLLSALGRPPLSAPEIIPMVGDGAGALVRRALAARDAEATSAHIEAFLADYTAHVADHTRAYPGVSNTLAALAASGWRLAVCTNKPAEAAREVLDRLGLLHHFAAIGAGDSYPTRKPDPAHLLATIDDAGGDPARAIMIGDHGNDLAAARAARLPSVFAAWGYGQNAGATATAGSMTDLPGITDRLGRRFVATRP